MYRLDSGYFRPKISHFSFSILLLAQKVKRPFDSSGIFSGPDISDSRLAIVTSNFTSKGNGSTMAKSNI
jgi:hypothetical protein